MKVLMTAMQPSGGIKTFFRYVYQQPAFNNDCFVLVAPDPDGSLQDFLNTTVAPRKIHVIHTGCAPLEFIKSVRNEMKSGDYDLIHSHGFGAGLLTELASNFIVGPKHLMTAHDVFLPSQFSSIKSRIKKHIMAAVFGKIDAIHTVTHDATGNFQEFFPSIPRSVFYPILHGVDTHYFEAGVPWNIREELSISTSIPIIGFFGRFMGQKGFRTLVEAIALIKERNDGNRPLPVVVTFGSGGFIREDYAYLEGLGLGDNFIQMEGTDDMPAMLKAMDMVVMPSRWEACGLLGMEVLAAGVPLISTDCIGLREVVSGSPARIFSPGDVGGLAELITKEIENPTKGVFRKYQPEAVQRFAIERPARTLRGLYHNLSGGL